MKCPFCHREDIKTQDANHPYRCAPSGLEKSDIKKMFIDHNYGHISKEHFTNLYVTENWSLPDFRREYGLPFKTTQWLCEYFGIEIRSIKDAIGGARKKFKATCLERYGVENPSQVESVKAKKADTFLRNYGERNIFATQEFIKTNKEQVLGSHKSGKMKSNYVRHRDWWAAQSTEYKSEVGQRLGEATAQHWANLNSEEKTALVNKRLDTLYKNKNHLKIKKSAFETRVAFLLKVCGINYVEQYKINRKFFDFKVGDNILIECQGDYWHCNPKKYSPDAVNKRTGMTALKTWEKDQIKLNEALSKDFEVVYIWESDLPPEEGDAMIFIQDLLTKFGITF